MAQVNNGNGQAYGKPSGTDDIACQSSVIQSASYDNAGLRLTLTFQTGLQQTYWPVFPATWEEFKKAPSKGRFYSYNIKGKTNSFTVKPVLKPSSLKRTKHGK